MWLLRASPVSAVRVFEHGKAKNTSRQIRPTHDAYGCFAVALVPPPPKKKEKLDAVTKTKKCTQVYENVL
jgi:hypothetical protein